jgi:hypothetical protein
LKLAAVVSWNVRLEIMKRAVPILLAPVLMMAQPPAAKPEDVASLDAIVRSLYDVISGPAGQKRDWDRMRSLFYPGARLIPARPTPEGGATATMLSVEDFIKRSEPGIAKGFFESEIRREIQTFGNIAHVFSTYESKRAQGEKPFARGINSFQLLKDGQRWWIVTIFWDSERPDNPLPAK